MVVSAFGLFILVGTLSSVANNGINSQISNIVPNVYGMSEAETSTLISAAGLLNIILFFPAGRLLANRGGVAVYSLGVVMRLVGALGMALVGLLADSAVPLAIAFMQILYQANPFARLAQPGVAVRFATFPPGMANGWIIAGSALGGFAGAAVGGVLADRYGFNAVNWMGAGAAALSVVVLVGALLPAARPNAARPAVRSRWTSSSPDWSRQSSASSRAGSRSRSVSRSASNRWRSTSPPASARWLDSSCSSTPVTGSGPDCCAIGRRKRPTPTPGSAR